MGVPGKPRPAKYFVALLCADDGLFDAVEKDLTSMAGDCDARSEPVPWTASHFYEREMGPRLLRRFLSFATLRSPSRLAEIKLETNSIEDRFRCPHKGGRRINLDPGYLDVHKVVLASTKNAGQRIYLRAGIYGEVTLLYHDGAFHSLEYTYPDYRWLETVQFFARIRARYVSQLKQDAE